MVVIHGHIDVVPGRDGQFEPRRRGRPADRPRRLRHEGRGRGDDARARRPARPARSCGSASRSSPTRRPRRSSTAAPTCSSTQGYGGDFAITGEPTDMLIGVAAKGVLALRIEVSGQGRARLDALGGRQRDHQGLLGVPGDRVATVLAAVVRAVRPPSINLGRIIGGDALNKVPDTCVIDVDIRYLPEQDPEAILEPDRRDPRHRGRLDLPAPAGRGRPGLRLRPRPRRRRGPEPRRRGDEHRPRRRLRRRLLHPRRDAGGRVRPRRRRPPRPRGMGVARLARRLPAHALRLRPRPARGDERRRLGERGRARSRRGASPTTPARRRPEGDEEEEGPRPDRGVRPARGRDRA